MEQTLFTEIFSQKLASSTLLCPQSHTYKIQYIYRKLKICLDSKTGPSLLKETVLKIFDCWNCPSNSPPLYLRTIWLKMFTDFVGNVNYSVSHCHKCHQRRWSTRRCHCHKCTEYQPVSQIKPKTASFNYQGSNEAVH